MQDVRKMIIGSTLRTVTGPKTLSFFLNITILHGSGRRGIFHGPLPGDYSGPSLNHSYPSVNRDRSFSPMERRGEGFACKSHSKSSRRYRIRSSDCGNPSSAYQSKSAVRMRRGRSPDLQSGFVADRVMGFWTMCRKYSLPPHNSRWICDWKDGMVHFRGQARFGQWNERFDFLDTPRNYKSVHTGRLLEVEGIGRGGPRCDGSDDNREKHCQRLGLDPPAKQYDGGGAVKRFHYKVDEGFVKGRNSPYGDGAVNGKRFRYNVDEGFVKGRNCRYEDHADFCGRGSPKQFGRGIDQPCPSSFGYPRQQPYGYPPPQGQDYPPAAYTLHAYNQGATGAATAAKHLRPLSQNTESIVKQRFPRLQRRHHRNNRQQLMQLQE